MIKWIRALSKSRSSSGNISVERQPYPPSVDVEKFFVMYTFNNIVLPFVMPGLVDATGSMTRKRKYADDAQGSKRRAMGSAMDRTSEQIGQMVEVHVLESQILQSQRYYNNLATLLAYAQPYLSSSSRRSQALFSLCRIFSRLMAGGCMTASKQAGDNEIVISKWLHERYEQYRAILLAILGDGAQDAQIVALRLLMQLFKEEGSDTSQGEDSIWNRGTFHLVLQRLVTSESTSTTRLIFAKEYVVAHDDMRLHTFLKLAFVEQSPSLS